jgi:hypothetical protein
MQLLAERDAVKMVRQAEHLPPRLVTLGMVTVEKACRGFVIQHQSQFPAEIVCILHTGVHALAADVGTDMGGVPEQEDPAGLHKSRKWRRTSMTFGQWARISLCPQEREAN